MNIHRLHPANRWGLRLLITVILTITPGTLTWAQPPTTQQLQQINSSLIPSDSARFFAQGHQALADEIMGLWQASLMVPAPILQVEEIWELTTEILFLTEEVPAPGMELTATESTNEF